jgi:cell division septal protein FtsQ
MVKDYSLYGKKHLKRDYYNKTFSNPYFNQRIKSKSAFNVKLWIQVLTVIFLVYLIIYSGIFEVKSVEIKGLEMISYNELENLIKGEISGQRWFIFPANNLIFVAPKKIRRTVESTYALDKLQINKSWQKLTIELEEKVIYLIVKNNKSYYFIDAFGTVIKELSAEDLSSYEKIFPLLYLDKDLNIGEQPISGRMVNYIIELDKSLKEKEINPVRYQSGEVDQVIVDTSAGWQAYFSINNSLSLSIENMMLLLEKKLSGRKFDYIDLRFGDRAIYFPE